jgi:hypothetical protein
VPEAHESYFCVLRIFLFNFNSFLLDLEVV